MRIEIGNLVRHEVGRGFGLALQDLKITLQLLFHGVEQDVVGGAESCRRQGQESRNA